MAVSTFDLYKIGIGPSSSHTVGPMRAAARFVSHWLAESDTLSRTTRIRAEVFGSLALTGRGHGTDKAVLMGLEGHWPNEINPDIIPAALERIRKDKKIHLLGQRDIAFDEKRDLVMNKRQKLPFHTNGMRFSAFDVDGNEIATRGVIDRTETNRRTAELLAKVGLRESPETKVGELGMGKQQLVEIAKALSKKVDLLILDEPTSSLNEHDSDALLRLLASFREQGMTAIKISH